MVIHEESEEYYGNDPSQKESQADNFEDGLGIPVIRRKLSTCNRTAAMNGRKSVDLRRSNLNLNGMDEAMPSTVGNLLNQSQAKIQNKILGPC